MGVGKLSIGTATDRIYLIGASGWFVGDWTPQAGDHLGTFSESALADYRAMQNYRDLTVTETLSLKVTRGSQNEIIRVTQDLRRMLREAIDYWTTNWQEEPVYIEAQADCESNPRYTLVHDGRLPEDRNPYAAPFMGKKSTMDNLTLAIEHGPWLENPPGNQTCVQTSATGIFATTTTTITGRPGASTDDAWATAGAYNIVSDIYLGNGGIVDGETVYTDGIRFLAMAIPAGSRIISAYVTFVASANLATAGVNCAIYGEDYDDAATYAGWADFVSRILTTQSATWSSIPAWILGSSYNTCDIAPIIQEITDRPGWANGNDITIKFYDNGSTTGSTRRAYSWDTLLASRPTLTVTYGPAITWGRTATCNNEVFIANKQNKAQISNVHTYRALGAVFGANQIATAFPRNLFSSVAGANNDAVYFGCNTSLANSGPFCSLVFDIGTAAAYSATNASIVWEYWTGAAWATLTVVDNTADGPGPFSLTGVLSVHWLPPSNWATTDPDGAGVVTPTGWWVRARQVIGGGGTITIPTQQNREVYTVTWGSCLIDEAQVPGDIPALLRYWLHCPSGTNSLYGTLGSDMVIAGLRSTDRGEDFSAYINLSNQQNPSGMAVYTSTLEVTLTADPRAVTGSWQLLNAATAGPHGFTEQFVIGLWGDGALPHYRGTYRAFIRCTLVSGAGGVAGDVGVRLKMGVYPQTEQVYSESAYNRHINIPELLDLGKINIPAFSTTINDPISYMNLVIEVYLGDNDFTVRFHDLILIPVDEWAMDSYQFEEMTAGTQSYFLGMQLLDTDGVTNPKKSSSVMCDDTYVIGGKLVHWRYHPNAWPHLLANKEQRLWIVTANPHWDTYLYRSAPTEMVHSIELWRNARYLSMRGNR